MDETIHTVTNHVDELLALCYYLYHEIMTKFNMNKIDRF